jgi:hypothetical protein
LPKRTGPPRSEREAFYYWGWLILPILIALAVFAAKTTPVFAPVANDSSASRPLIRDERQVRIDRYFAERNMPLASHGAKFAEAADRCDMDWRLLPAIAVRESSGGKQACGNNPFGWASCRLDFESVEQAIEIVGANLCGFNPGTEIYYKNKTTYEKLWSYNGTVNPQYPDEVIGIMESF